MSARTSRVNGILFDKEQYGFLDIPKVKGFCFTTTLPLSENGELSSFLFAKKGMETALDLGFVSVDVFAKGVYPFSDAYGIGSVKLVGKSTLGGFYNIFSRLRPDSLRREILDSHMQGRKNLTLTFTVDVVSFIQEEYITEVPSPKGIANFTVVENIIYGGVPFFPNIFTTRFWFPYLQTEAQEKTCGWIDFESYQSFIKNNPDLAPKIKEYVSWAYLDMDVVLKEALY